MVTFVFRHFSTFLAWDTVENSVEKLKIESDFDVFGEMWEVFEGI
jgi:hypothetical protein